MNPKYPIYIISKGRWESRLTAKELEYLKVPYRIVIEPQEYEQYAKVIDKSKILILPFSNLGQGGIPARNWVREHSISEGHERHWILDDNIGHFYRFNNNKKIRVNNGTIFKCCEDFTDRYKNVPMSGMNYHFFAVGIQGHRYPPFYLNTRVYSCILLSNEEKHRFMRRGRYNEDTDLSIRFLKAGYCTILYNAFLAGKSTTMTMKGGNTTTLYVQNDKMDGRLLMAQSLANQHPDIVKITRKWGRRQHQVNYNSFKKNMLIKKNIVIDNETNNYNMSLQKIVL